MEVARRPYRRTHTLSFYGCECKHIFSPSVDGELAKLVVLFEQSLINAGFTITTDISGKHDIVARPFGDGYGYTVMAVLSESSCVVHTYPEDRFGRTVEVELNLCYLSVDHGENIRSLVRALEALFKPTSFERCDSPKRYLDPVS